LNEGSHRLVYIAVALVYTVVLIGNLAAGTMSPHVALWWRLMDKAISVFMALNFLW